MTRGVFALLFLAVSPGAAFACTLEQTAEIQRLGCFTQQIAKKCSRAVTAPLPASFKAQKLPSQGVLKIFNNQSPQVIDVILHHAFPGETARSYNFSTYEKPARLALTAWANHVESVAGQRTAQPSNVISLSEVRTA